MIYCNSLGDADQSVLEFTNEDSTKDGLDDEMLNLVRQNELQGLFEAYPKVRDGVY